jgi:uncharacterized protein (DUF362 family)/Pyruvate/2-oxoacid:ferredoxin oxidoreductase delta subunit
MAEKDKAKVAIVRCADYKNTHVEAALSKSLTLLGGIRKFVKKGDRVLLKVNLLTGRKPEDAVTTHPSVVRAVIRLVKAAGGKPSVADSPSASSIHSFDHQAEVCGLKQVCEELKVPLFELSEPIQTPVPNGKVAKSFMLSGKLKDFDVIINLPKLKTHSLTGFTGGIKNLYGCVSGRHKGYYHIIAQDGQRFSEMLLDLFSVVKPQLNILDAVVSMEGNGPSAGDPRRTELILAATDALALDAVACAIIDMEKEVPVLNIAKKRKMPQAELSHIEVLGEPIHKVKVKDFKRPGSMAMFMIPTPVRKLVRNFILRKPVVVPEICINCGSCARVCPKNAITMERGRPVFDYDLCIRCYCCQEVCPQKAIVLKGNFIYNLLFRKKEPQHK